MSPSSAVGMLHENAEVKTVIIDILRVRARAAGADEHVITRAVERATELFAAWEDIAAEQAAGGSPFSYEEGSAQRRLLQIPLDPSTENLSAGHQQFVAARSMRDVEYGSYLKVRDPSGNVIRGATDVE